MMHHVTQSQQTITYTVLWCSEILAKLIVFFGRNNFSLPILLFTLSMRKILEILVICSAEIVFVGNSFLTAVLGVLATSLSSFFLQLFFKLSFQKRMELAVVGILTASLSSFFLQLFFKLNFRKKEWSCLFWGS